MDLPLIYPVHQQWTQPRVDDVSSEVRQRILASRLRDRVKAGGSVAIAVGSRGIADIRPITKATIAVARELGFQPFVVAAMGSHGGATADGQRELLATYGITEESLGVAVRTEMDAVQIGVNSWNEPVYWDRNALAADGVITLARVKPHTDFRGRFESGIVKMLAIGLGKQQGAATHHQYGVRGLRDMIPETAKVVVAKTPFALGIAILENANEQTALIRAVEPERLFEEEQLLLEQARGLVGTIPFDELDLLVVGELGKNYSGTGMDVNVIGRQQVEGEPDSCKPKITRICVLDLSAESHGNAVGAGLADLVSQRLIDKTDVAKTNMNYFTSCFMLRAKMPLAMPTDRECIEMGLKSCWQPRLDQVRMAIIPNTLELANLWVTPPLAESARGQANLRTGEPQALTFEKTGALDLRRLFPHSTQGRRQYADHNVS